MPTDKKPASRHSAGDVQRAGHDNVTPQPHRTRARMSPGNLYYHFRHKSEIVRARLPASRGVGGNYAVPPQPMPQSR